MPLNDDDSVSNPSSNRHFNEVLEVNLKRRQVLMGGLALATAGFFGVPRPRRPAPGPGGPHPVPPGLRRYRLRGHRPPTALDPGLSTMSCCPRATAFRSSTPGVTPSASWVSRPASRPARRRQQRRPSTRRSNPAPTTTACTTSRAPGAAATSAASCASTTSTTTKTCSIPDGMANWDLEKVRKSQHAHGVSVIEVWVNPRTRQWEVKRPSPFARRIHGNTPMQLTGPAAGDDL